MTSSGTSQNENKIEASARKRSSPSNTIAPSTSLAEPGRKRIPSTTKRSRRLFTGTADPKKRHLPGPSRSAEPNRGRIPNPAGRGRCKRLPRSAAHPSSAEPMGRRIPSPAGRGRRKRLPRSAVVSAFGDPEDVLGFASRKSSSTRTRADGTEHPTQSSAPGRSRLPRMVVPRDRLYCNSRSRCGRATTNSVAC